MSAFNWEEFVSLAESIRARILAGVPVDSPAHQAWTRTGYSRAYYGVLHTAMSKIISIEGPQYLGQDRMSSHAEVIRYFRFKPDIHELLKACRRARVKSDYLAEPGVTTGELRQVINDARQAISLLHAL